MLTLGKIQSHKPKCWTWTTCPSWAHWGQFTTQRRILIQCFHDSFRTLDELPVTAPTPINGATVEPLNEDEGITGHVRVTLPTLTTSVKRPIRRLRSQGGWGASGSTFGTCFILQLSTRWNFNFCSFCSILPGWATWAWPQATGTEALLK